MADREKREEDENTNIWISRERKELFPWKKKSIFHNYLRAIIWWINEKYGTCFFGIDEVYKIGDGWNVLGFHPSLHQSFTKYSHVPSTIYNADNQFIGSNQKLWFHSEKIKQFQQPFFRLTTRIFVHKGQPIYLVFHDNTNGF